MDEPQGDGPQIESSSAVRDMTPEEEAQIERYETPPRPTSPPSPASEPFREFEMDEETAPALTPAQQYEIMPPHERLVEDVMELVAGLWRTKYSKEPDEKYLAEMRRIYAAQTDDMLEAEVKKMMTKLSLVPKT